MPLPSESVPGRASTRVAAADTDRCTLAISPLTGVLRSQVTRRASVPWLTPLAFVGSPPPPTRLSLGRGPVISVKHSLDYRILSIQRTSRTVVFLNRAKGLDKTEYSQSCKSKSSSHLLGFVWVGATEVVFITNLGLEYYMVYPEKRSLKLIKSYNLTVNWFVYSSENKVLLLSSSLQANVLQPYHFKDGSITRLSKFEAELPFVYNQLSQKLLERDVYLAPIYQRLYCMIVKNNPKGHPGPKVF